VDLAASYGWGIGDQVPVLGTIYPRLDGSAWELTVNAIYRTNTAAIEQNTMYFQFDYLRESIESGEVPGELDVGVYLTVIAPGRNPTQVMADVDALFENGPQRVQATTEAEFNRQFISMLGNVPALLSAIGGAVLFAIFFAVLNTMLMAGRERIRDVGIMKALGYTDRAVFGTLLMEAILLCGAGGLLGLGAAIGAETSIARLLAGRVPGFGIDMPTIWMGLGIALGIGALSGVIPGWLASRLSPVRALRMTG
jgi:putative ABC transport system permease protein